jgi:hypothetical protein
VTEEDILEEANAQAERSRMSNSGSINKKQLITKEEEAGDGDLEGYSQKIKTYITHNKGASWELIRAPETDMRGNPNKCFIEDGCSLHL